MKTSVSGDWMKKRIPRKVAMIVLNGVVNDSRVKKTAASLSSRGYEVTIFGLSRKIREGVERIDLNDGIEVALFPDRRRNLTYGGDPGDRWKLLQLGLVSEMWPHIQKMKPQFIHSHDFGAIRIGYEFTERLRESGHIACWIHDLHEYVAGLEQLEEGILREALIDQEELIRIPDHLITVSGPIAMELTRDYNLSRPPDTVFNCPKNPGVLSERGVKEELQLGPEDPLIVYAGGLAKQRGLENVISSLKTLRSHHLCIVTDKNSKYIPILEKMSIDLKVSDRVHFVDYVDYSELPSFISDADIAIHPMLKYRNGDLALPNKLFDYLHSELPIIVGECETMSNFVRRWGLGLSFDTGNLASLIDTIEKMTDRDFKIDTRNRGYLVKRYSWEKQEEKIIEIYRNAEQRMALFLENLADIGISLEVDGKLIKGNIDVDYFAGPFSLMLFEDGQKKIEVDTDRNGDFVFDIGLVGSQTETQIFEFRARRWGDLALSKIKITTENGELAITEMPLK